MFDTTKLQDCLGGLFGWRDHYDTDEIPPLGGDLNASESGEHFQDWHPALRLDLISASLPENRELPEYLRERVDTAISQLGNHIFTQKKLGGFARELLSNGMLINGHGWASDTVMNEGRFVGIRLGTVPETGALAVVNRLGLQFDRPQEDLDIYIYHSSRTRPVAIVPFSSEKGLQWHWTDTALPLDDIGGYWTIGYYQDDIVGHAIQYRKLNWKTGYCSSCNGGVDRARWNSIGRYVSAVPIYVPAASLGQDRGMFDMEGAFTVYDNNFGINLDISVKCDLTAFLCDNRTILKNALGLKVAHLILRDIKFSQQLNAVEESLKHLIIRDLEGDRDTNYVNIADQLERAVRAIDVDTDHLSRICLPCTKAHRVKYRVV